MRTGPPKDLPAKAWPGGAFVEEQRVAETERPRPLRVALLPEVAAVARAHLRSGGGAPPPAGGPHQVSGDRALAPPGRLAVPVRDPAWHRPVFLLAPARSNSSVISSMVGMHPQLYGFPELSLFRGERVADLIEDGPAPQVLPARARTAGLARAVAQLHDGNQDVESVARARRWLRVRAHWPVACVLDHLLDLVSPAVGVEKSPENANREDYLERLASAYPRARFLHVTRHPVTATRSMYTEWSGKGLWDVPDEWAHLHVLGTWFFNHARIRRFTESLPPDRWFRVRSEDVLNHPVEHLTAICRWLGIDSGPQAVAAMRHPERSVFARLGPPNAMGGNDPKFLRQPVPHPAELPDTMELPADWQVDPWLHVAVVEFAATIGYRAADGGPRRTAARAASRPR